MMVTAWSNGYTAYGIKIDANDRDKYFKKEWKTIILELEGLSTPIEINVDKPSFWNQTCRELISKEIGQWLKENRLVPWTFRKPPKLRLEFVTSRKFRLRKG